MVVLGTAGLMAYFDVNVTLWKRASLEPGSFAANAFQVITRFGTSGWILIITLSSQIAPASDGARAEARQVHARPDGPMGDPDRPFQTGSRFSATARAPSF